MAERKKKDLEINESQLIQMNYNEYKKNEENRKNSFYLYKRKDFEHFSLYTGKIKTQRKSEKGKMKRTEK